MKSGISGRRGFGLALTLVCLALQTTPAAADSTASGSFAGTIEGKPYAVTFKDAYAFRAENRQKEQVTVVILSETPLDAKAMTAALRKDRRAITVDDFIYKLSYARIDIDQAGRTDYSVISVQGKAVGINPGKTDIKVNTERRIEGTASETWTGSMLAGKLEMRFAADLADLGPPARK